VVIVACECSWGIPGVERLPAHSHTDTVTVLSEDGRREITFPATQWTPSRVALQIVARTERINVWVDWKAVARALSTRPEAPTGVERPAISSLPTSSRGWAACRG
jgi:hypothetical protein